MTTKLSVDSCLLPLRQTHLALRTQLLHTYTLFCIHAYGCASLQTGLHTLTASMRTVGIPYAHRSKVGKQQPLLNETACSLAAMTSAVELSVVSSVADCVQFYWDSLTKTQRCGLDVAGGGGMQWHGFRCEGSGAPRPLQRLGLQAHVQSRT